MTPEDLQAEALRQSRTHRRGEKANGVGDDAEEIIWYRDARLETSGHYVIKGLIGAGDNVALIGATGSGKTFFGIDLACHAGAGLPWRGLRVRQGVVLYLAPEAGRSVLRRVIAWRQFHGIADVKLAIRPLPVDLLRPDADTINIIALCNRIAAEHGSIVLIVVDTASRAMPGGKECAEEFTALIANCDRIRAASGAAVMLIHHHGKDPSKGSRGSSTFPAALDSEISIAEHVAKVTKQRDSVSGTEYPFRLETVQLGSDDDGDTITSCVVVPAEITEVAGPQLREEEAGWLRDLCDLFADPDRHGLKQVRPEPDMPIVWGATRDQVRDWLRHRGRIGVADSVALNATDRSRLQRYLGRLKDKGKIGISGDAIWLIP